MDITEFREKYPKYSNMSDQQIAAKLYDRYYSKSMSRQEFYQSFGVPYVGSITEFRKAFPKYSNMSDQQIAAKLYKRYYSNDMSRSEFHKLFGVPYESVSDKIKKFIDQRDYFPPKEQTPVDDVPEWGRGKVGANLYGMYGAVKETGKSLIPYAKYIDPKEREEFMRLNQQGQTNQLLKDALEAEIFVAFPAIAKTVGGVLGAVGERIAPKLTKALTKERHLIKNPVPEVPKETPVPKVEEPIEKPVPAEVLKDYPDLAKGKDTPAPEKVAPTQSSQAEIPLKQAEMPVEGKPAKSPERIAQQSRVFERLQQEHPEALQGTLGYTKINLEKEAEIATDLIASDKQKAYRLAMNLEESPDVTNTAVNIAMAERARLDGNITLYSQLVKRRSLDQTRRGQEIVAEKLSVTNNAPERYIKMLVQSRLETIGEKISGLRGATKSKKGRALERIDAEVEKIKHATKEKWMDIADAQKLLDSLACS